MDDADSRRMRAKVSTEALRERGLRLVAEAGNPLVREADHRGQIYRTRDAKTVRLRTSNDRNLPCKSSSVDPSQGTLDIEGTDYVYLVVSLERRRLSGIEGYLLPTDRAVAQVKDAHTHWLKHEGNTAGRNSTPALFLDRVPSGETEKLHDLWAAYRIGEVVV